MFDFTLNQYIFFPFQNFIFLEEVPIELRKLSDKDLLAQTETLVQKERDVLTEILRHLNEIQRRRLYSDLGLPSLFAYCTQVLKYSESQTQRRIDAMRLIQEIPEVEEKISSGEISLTNLAQAQTFFRREEKVAPLNSQEKLGVILELENKSSRDGEKILLSKSLMPTQTVVEKFRQVTAEMTEIKFGADEKLLAKMKKVKGLLAHKNGNLNVAELFDELCEIALNKLDPSRNKAALRKEMPKIIPPAPKVKSQRKYISVHDRREIWQSAESKCTRCGSENALQIDHVEPIALGGNSNKENLRLLCRSCNQRMAIKNLGDTKMMRYLT